MIYIILFFISFIGMYAYEIWHSNITSITVGKAFQRKKILFYHFECLALILVAGLRYEVGGDTLIYMEYFKEDPSLTELAHFDFLTARFNPLWYVFQAICKSIINKFWFFQLVHATVFNMILFRFFRRHCNRFMTAAFLYTVYFFITFNTETLRASLAICVWLFAFDFLLEKKWLKYYILCIIAMGFHTEAAITLVFPLCFVLKNIRINIVSTSLIFGIAFIGILVFDLTSYISLLTFLAERDMNKLMDFEGSTSFRFGLLAGLKVLIWVVMLWFIDKAGRKQFDGSNTNHHFELGKGVLIIYIIGLMLAMRYNTLFSRTMDFLSPIAILYAVYLLEVKRIVCTTNIRKAVFSISMTLYFLIGIFQWIPLWDRYNPYISVLNPRENTKLIQYMEDDNYRVLHQ